MSSWRDEAACRGKDVNIFFPPAGGEKIGVVGQGVTTVGNLRALKICARCPVREACLEANLGEREGVWGGTTPGERRRLRRMRRQGEAA